MIKLKNILTKILEVICVIMFAFITINCGSGFRRIGLLRLRIFRQADSSNFTFTVRDAS